jgi:predicted Zn-dependent protease
MSALLLAGLCLVSVGCVSDSDVRQQAVSAHTELQPSVITDPELAGYLQQVGQRIIASAKQLKDEGYGPAAKSKEDSSWMFSPNMQFHIVASDTLNAFTTGGEHMYIYSGLLLKCDTEDELAAVMAHEYGHVYGRHVENGIRQGYVQQAVGVGAQLADSQGYGEAGQLSALAAKYVGMGFTRHDEDQADDLGFHFYTRAGWDPNHFADFFKRMIALGYDTTPEYASDHPKLSNRVTATQARTAQLGADGTRFRRPPVADAQKFAAVKVRLQRVVASLPKDKSMQKAQSLLASFSSCVSPTESQPQQVKVRKAVQKQ